MAKKKRQSYHHGDLRNALIAAAILEIRESGPYGISFREVAKRAGVSHTAPYRHFADKHALLAAIAQEGFRLLGDSMAEVATRFADDSETMIIEAGRAYVELAVQNPEINLLMFGGFIDPERCPDELKAIADRAFDNLLVIINTCQSSGVLREGEPRQLALATWSMAHGFAMLVTGGQLNEELSSKQAVEDMSRNLGRMLLQGLGTKK